MVANYKSKFTSGIVERVSLEQMSAMGRSETVAERPEAAFKSLIVYGRELSSNFGWSMTSDADTGPVLVTPFC